MPTLASVADTNVLFVLEAFLHDSVKKSPYISVIHNYFSTLESLRVSLRNRIWLVV